MTEIKIDDIKHIGNNLLGFKHTVLTGSEIQNVFDFYLLFMTLRLDISYSCFVISLGIYKAYIKFGAGVA